MNFEMLAAEMDLLSGSSVGMGIVGTAIGCGLIVFGASFGISKIAGNAVESIARQPEAGGRIFTTMIISAALIEGFTFFAIVVCLLGVSNLETLAKLSLGITE